MNPVTKSADYPEEHMVTEEYNHNIHKISNEYALDHNESPENESIDNIKILATQIRYEYKQEPQFTQTRALFVGNMRPSFDTEEFKHILLEEAKRANCTIERAWLNSCCSHCFILSSDVPGATAIRDRLNGYVINDIIEENGDTDNDNDAKEKMEEDENQMRNNKEIKLVVEYVPVRALDTWIDDERGSPPDAIWKLSFIDSPSKLNPGTFFKTVLHEMINYPNRTSGYIGLRKRSRFSHNTDLIRRQARFGRRSAAEYRNRDRSPGRSRYKSKSGSRERPRSGPISGNDGRRERDSYRPYRASNRRSDTYTPSYDFDDH